MTHSKWIVLDLGNVILNNDPLMAYIYKLAYTKIKGKAKEIRFPDILNKRLELHKRGVTEDTFLSIVKDYLSEKEIEDFKSEYKSVTYNKIEYYFPFINGSKEFCGRLNHKYNLGILANQPAIIKQHLIKNKYYPFFKFIGLSEEISLSKPNIEIFNWMISKTGSNPEDIYYIGDTIYNDIVPANSLGIKTILLRHKVYEKGFKAKDTFESYYLECQEKIDNYVVEQARKLEFALAITLTYEQALYYLDL